MMGPGMAAICPTVVANTTTRAEEADGSAALAFTTTGDVADVRRRVAGMTETYNLHQSGGHGFMMRMGGMGVGRGMAGTGAMGTGAMGAGAMGTGATGTGTMGAGAMGSDAPGGVMHGGMMMLPSTARSEDIEGGARLVLTPRDPVQLQTLRQHTQQMAAGMAARQCPIMENAGHGNTP
ncbi:MAG: hypothetical protein ABIY55_20210 [Kofleriaceae bacterium]